jgi:electron transport complex protein RnfE
MVNGLWKNNPALVQLIGLCPLLAISTTVLNAFSLGCATLFVLTLSNSFISLLRRIIPHSLRLPIFIMIIASLVICASLLMEAFSYPLYEQLGLFFALITTNCAVLARAEAFAYSQPIHYAAFDGFMQGLGFFLILLLLGSVREILGSGTFLQMPLFSNDYQFLLALLPPGAFLVLGFVVAGYNYWERKDISI